MKLYNKNKTKACHCEASQFKASCGNLLKYSKKAAMFGLDARIALAIFGALSVITGAALYSAIQRSKVVSLVSDLNEIGKALEAYILDTGHQPPMINSRGINAEALVSSTEKGWQGPYLNYKHIATTAYLDHPVYNRVVITRLASTGYDDGDSTHSVECTSDSECYIYALINGVPKTIADAADIYVDGQSGISSGNLLIVRGFTGGGAESNDGVLLKVMPAIDKP